MKIKHFPYNALVLGSILTKGSAEDSSGATVLPLLTLLVMSEFGFIVTAIGVYLGGRHILSGNRQPAYIIATILCVILSLRLLLLGIALWPGKL